MSGRFLIMNGANTVIVLVAPMQVGNILRVYKRIILKNVVSDEVCLDISVFILKQLEYMCPQYKQLQCYCKQTV